MKYALVQIKTPAGMLATKGMFNIVGIPFDTLEQAQAARAVKEKPDWFIIIQVW